MAGLTIVPAPSILLQLAERLRALEYTEERAAAALDLAHLGLFFEQAHSLYRYSLLRAEPRLATLVRLFLVSDPVPIQDVLQIMERELLIGLVRGGVMAVAEEGFVRCRYLLNPIDGAFIFTDRRVKSDMNRIMPLGHDTYNLVSQTQQRPGATVLDLGTGSGVQGVLAARWASRVVSVDINPRALDFARLNAHLNGVYDRMELHLGSLYEPVVGRRFDVILANPPFVPNPQYDVLFRDGGVQGEDILHIIIRDAPNHLEDDGILQIMTEIIYHDQRDPADKVREWAEDRLRGIIFEQDEGFLDIYAQEHIFRSYDAEDSNATLQAKVSEYQKFLDSVNIWKITHATLHLVPDQPPAPETEAAARRPVAIADVANLRGVGAARVAQGLLQAELVSEPDWLEQARDFTVRFDPDLQVVARWVPAQGAAQPAEVEFAAGSPWRRTVLKSIAFELLRRLATCTHLQQWLDEALPLFEESPEEARLLLRQFLSDLVQSRWIDLVTPEAAGQEVQRS